MMQQCSFIIILFLAKCDSAGAAQPDARGTVIALATVVAILSIIIVCGIAWLIFKKIICIHCLRTADTEQINSMDGMQNKGRQCSQDSSATEYEQMSSVFNRGFKFSFNRSSQKGSQGLTEIAGYGKNAFRINGGPSSSLVAPVSLTPPPLLSKSPTVSGKHTMHQPNAGDEKNTLKIGGSLLSVNQMLSTSQDSVTRALPPIRTPKLTALARVVADDDDEDPYDTLPIRDAPKPVHPVPAEDNSVVKHSASDGTFLTGGQSGGNVDSALDKENSLMNNQGKSPAHEICLGNSKTLPKEIEKGENETASHSDLQMRGKNMPPNVSKPRKVSAEESEVNTQGGRSKNKKDKKERTGTKVTTSPCIFEQAGVTASVTHLEIQKDLRQREAKVGPDHFKVSRGPGDNEFQSVSVNAMAQQLNLKLENDAKALAQEKRNTLKKYAARDSCVSNPDDITLRKQVVPQKHIGVTRDTNSQSLKNGDQNGSRDSRLNPIKRQSRKSRPGSKMLEKRGKMFVENEELSIAMAKMKSKQQQSVNSSSGEGPFKGLGTPPEKATSGITPPKKSTEGDNKSSSEEEDVEEEEETDDDGESVEEEEDEEYDEEEVEEEEEEEEDEDDDEEDSSSSD